jgi:bifunctional DNA-binding transcriptional regulator/antitoxin component of YhaV-PrlF toxin-antitoxin module
MTTKVTSELQVTIPKVIAEHYGIAPGQEIEWLHAGDAIRVVPQSAAGRARDRQVQLGCSTRQQPASARQSARPVQGEQSKDRGWRREDLHERGDAG